MRLKQGYVINPASNIITTQWGERQTITVKLADGTEEKIWFSAGKTPHASLTKGDVVTVIYEESNGKTTKRLVVNDDNNYNGSKDTSKYMIPNTQTPKINMTEDEKTAIKEYVNFQLGIYTHCLKVTKERMENEQLLTADEDIRTIATTIFIATQRKFNL